MANRRTVARVLAWQPVAIWVTALLIGVVGIVVMLSRRHWAEAVVLALFSGYCGVRVPIAARRAKSSANQHRESDATPTSGEA